MFPDSIDIPSVFLAYISFFLTVYILLWTLCTLALYPLSHISGPLWPRLSRTWLMYQHYAGDVDIATRALHTRYGPIVRIAPDKFTVADPRALSFVYSVQEALQKTDWYVPWRPKGLGSQPGLFTQTDERAHRRIAGGMYSFSSMLKSEAGLDEMLELFMQRLGGFADSGDAFDFGLWLEVHSFGNIGVAFFGQAFGFARDSVDYNGYIHAVHLAMPFLTPLTVTPYYARPSVLLVTFCIPKLLMAVPAVEDIRKAVVKETEAATERTLEVVTGKRPDVVSQLLAIVQEKGEQVNYSHKEITSDMWVRIMAGADSTSINMRSVMYFLMKNVEKLKRARAEVDAAFENGSLSSPVRYSQASSLPYLTAVKEAGRRFPAFSVSVPRYAPIQGLMLCDKFIPGGYTVGMNPAIVEHDTGVFGEDAPESKPKRWLESEERTRAMDSTILAWGTGTRTCVGKPLALTQTYKVTAETLRRYAFEMAHNRSLRVHNCSFNVQTDLVCRFKRRDSSPT